VDNLIRKTIPRLPFPDIFFSMYLQNTRRAKLKTLSFFVP